MRRDWDIENPMLLDESKLFRPKVFRRCSCCGYEIYYGEDYLEWNDIIIHPDCRYEFANGRFANEFERHTAGE